MNNTVIGYNTSTMEVSLDGTTWTVALPDLSGNKTLRVRVKAQGANPVSPATTLTFTANPTTALPACPTNATNASL